MLSPKKKLINKIRSFLLLEQDKEINKIINSSNTRINGLTSKEFMEKNKINYEISINNGIIYDCYKLPKNEEVECNILGKYCNKITFDHDRYKKIKENKINLAKRKNYYKKKNKNLNLIRKPFQINTFKENMHFLKRMSFCLKSPKNEKGKVRKSVGNINLNRSQRLKINLESESDSNSNSDSDSDSDSDSNSDSDLESRLTPIKKKSTKNLNKIMMKLNLGFLKNIYKKSYILTGCHREFI